MTDIKKSNHRTLLNLEQSSPKMKKRIWPPLCIYTTHITQIYLELHKRADQIWKRVLPWKNKYITLDLLVANANPKFEILTKAALGDKPFNDEVTKMWLLQISSNWEQFVVPYRAGVKVNKNWYDMQYRQLLYILTCIGCNDNYEGHIYI